MADPNYDRVDANALAEAFVQRMTWPSLHWATQRLDYDAALALAHLALEVAPGIIASARIKEQAMSEAMSATEATR